MALLLLLSVPPRTVRAQDSAAQAHQHYQSGVALFEAGNKEQALIEFRIAHELVPKKENLFMLAQCEYHLGLLTEARTHYQSFLVEQGAGELSDIARLRIEAINRRPGVLAINTVPDQVQVKIEGEGQTFTGDAPNEFRVPHGRYRITVSKANFTSQERKVDIEVAETKPLFFKLDPIPARLEIRTSPPDATLYVRGNRAQNPYAQKVEPGSYEIYAEAGYYLPRREIVTLTPGQQLKLDFPLAYVQRSGRPELIGFWIGIGAIGGGMAVLTRLDPKEPTSLTLTAAGALAGGIGAGVLATALVPQYLRDNLALFRIGGMWIGDVEGLALGLALTQTVSGAWLGGAAGLTAGALAGWWLDHRAPNYGRVAVIQSGALLGGLAAMLAVPAAGYDSTDPTVAARRLGWGALAGLNAGLAAGLALAYLPDQRLYGPTWQRVVLIDLAAAAGAFTGALLEICIADQRSVCGSANLTKSTARFALAGSLVGLGAGWLLTMSYDGNRSPASAGEQTPPIPLPAALPVQAMDGRMSLVPGLLSQGRY